MLNDPVLVVPVLAGLIMLWPARRICQRAGLPAWWGLTVLIPYVGLMVYAMLLAHRPWPAVPPRPAPPPRPAKRDIRHLLKRRGS